MKPENSTLMWRIVAGILAVISTVLVMLRLFGYAPVWGPITPGSVMELLRLLFPLAVALISAYMAVRGKIPFTAM